MDGVGVGAVEEVDGLFVAGKQEAEGGLACEGVANEASAVALRGEFFERVGFDGNLVFKPRGPAVDVDCQGVRVGCYCAEGAGCARAVLVNLVAENCFLGSKCAGKCGLHVVVEHSQGCVGALHSSGG